jgi:hypothetical protein
MDSDPHSQAVIYSILRKLERLNRIVECLVDKGILTRDDLQFAELHTVLSHGERIIRLREKQGADTTAMRQACDTIRQELENRPEHPF